MATESYTNVYFDVYVSSMHIFLDRLVNLAVSNTVFNLVAHTKVDTPFFFCVTDWYT